MDALNFRMLANAIPQLAWMGDANGGMLWFNDRWLEYTGQTQESSLGWAWQAVHRPDELADTVERWRRSLSTGQPLRKVLHLQGSDGKYRPFLSIANPIRDESGAIVAWIGTHTDITEQVAAEERLRARDRELQALTDTSPDVLARFDRHFRHLFVSSAVTQATNLLPSAFLGKTNRDLGMPSDLCDLWEEALGSVFETGTPRSLEFSYTTPAGPCHFASRIVPERDAYGEVENVLAVTQDITARKIAEQAVRDADRRKDEFLATLAHELRNPLAPIRTGLEVLNSTSDAKESERVRTMMGRQLAHLIRLVDDLLDVSRITSGKVVLKKQRIDLREVIDVAVEGCRPFIDAAKHTLTVATPPTPVWVDGDATRLAQVLSNILNNASKYTSEGGRIDLTLQRQDDAAVLQVQDNGYGIPPELLPDVFTMFAQVNRTLHRSQGGLGIGLALVKRLVEKHGGKVEARSGGLGQGSTFIVNLPALLSIDEPNGSPTKPSVRPQSPALRVLVVDDNEDGADLLAMLLEGLGHHSVAVYSGEAALEKAAVFQPQLVFCDIGLPGISGYDVGRALRAHAQLANVMLVALTGWGSEEDKRQSKGAGFDHHLVKPVELAALNEVLAKLSSSDAPAT